MPSSAIYRRRRASLAALVMMCAAPAEAQPFRYYAGGAIGAFRATTDQVHGTAVAAGVVAGLAARPWLDVEVEATWPGSPFTRSYGGDALSLSFAPPGATADEIARAGIWLRYDTRRDVSASVSGVTVFHPARGTIRPGVVVGVTTKRVTDRTVYTPVRIGSNVAPLNPSARVQVEAASHVTGAVTIGGNVTIDIGRHLSIVPDVRYDYGSIGDEIDNALRSSVRLLWRF